MRSCVQSRARFRGESRGGCWPRAARCVERATTRARLYDLGKYPAILPGDDRVLGELWHLAPDDMEVTLAALDQIECFSGQDDDLYVRRIVDCETSSGQIVRAYAYFLAKPVELGGARVVTPGEAGHCHWTGSK